MSAPTEKELHELNVWICERAMEWERVSLGDIEKAGQFAAQGHEILIRDRGNFVKLFTPTTDPASAITVLEKCAEAQMGSVSICHRSGPTWFVGLIDWDTESVKLESSADTLPLAIARFARKIFEK